MILFDKLTTIIQYDCKHKKCQTTQCLQFLGSHRKGIQERSKINYRDFIFLRRKRHTRKGKTVGIFGKGERKIILIINVFDVIFVDMC